MNAAEGVAAALEKIKEAGITVVQTYGDFKGKFAGVQFLDPSGNVLEIAGKP
jgi:predicted enzyme related to lactoylglutathione lyase